MYTKTSTIIAIAAMLLGTSALPTTEEHAILPNLHVLIRGENNTYARSEAMEDEIRSRQLGSFDKRSSGTVQACYTGTCTNCYSVFSGSFSSNTGCLAAPNTACLIISDLEDANVEFWNHPGCNGANTVYHGCGGNTANVPAPGTNSVGVHVGC